MHKVIFKKTVFLAFYVTKLKLQYSDAIAKYIQGLSH